MFNYRKSLPAIVMTEGWPGITHEHGVRCIISELFEENSWRHFSKKNAAGRFFTSL